MNCVMKDYYIVIIKQTKAGPHEFYSRMADVVVQNRYSYEVYNYPPLFLWTIEYAHRIHACHIRIQKGCPHGSTSTE